MMLVISNETVNAKIASDFGMKVLGVLFVFSLASAVFGIYATFAWTNQFYGLGLGVLLSTTVFLGVLFFNAGGFKSVSNSALNNRVVRWITLGAGFSYTLFVTHYPIIIFVNGLNLPVNRYLMFLPILLLTNVTALAIAYFTEKKHKALAKTIKKWLHITQ
jgi:peptidoglycan/LPS O-acetylase OafA/YrhL